MFFSRTCFPKSESLHVSVFCHFARLRISQSIKAQVRQGERPCPLSVCLCKKKPGVLLGDLSTSSSSRVSFTSHVAVGASSAELLAPNNSGPLPTTERQGNGSPPGVFWRKHSPADSLDCSPVRPGLDFQPTEPEDNKFALF